MQTRRPHPIGEYLALLLQTTMNSSKLSSRHLVLNWLSERGEYSKAAGLASLSRKISSIGLFLVSIYQVPRHRLLVGSRNGAIASSLHLLPTSASLYKSTPNRSLINLTVCGGLSREART